MKPTLRQLQYLVALDEAETFSGAARYAHVSQPSLSTQIKDMEEVLGVTLVERGRGGAPLTPVGQELVGRARIILRDMEAFKTLAREAGQTFAGRIRLGTLPSIGPYLLPLVMRRLHRKYPDLRMFVREENTRDLQAHLEDGHLDVIISNPDDHPDMKAEPLFNEKIYIGVAPDDDLARDAETDAVDATHEGPPIALARLKGRELLTLGPGHKFANKVQQIADESGAHVSAEYEGTSLDAIRQMAEMGGTVAVLPSLYAYSEACEDPGIIIRRIDHTHAQRDIALIWRPTSPLSAKFRAIADELKTASETLLSQGRD